MVRERGEDQDSVLSCQLAICRLFALPDSHTPNFVTLYPPVFQQTVQWPVGLSIRPHSPSHWTLNLQPAALPWILFPSCDRYSCAYSLWLQKFKKKKFLSFLGPLTDNTRSFWLFLAQVGWSQKHQVLWGLWGSSFIFHEGALVYNSTVDSSSPQILTAGVPGALTGKMIQTWFHWSDSCW